MRLIFAGALLAAVSACATPYKLTAIPTDGQQLEYFRGQATLTSFEPTSIVAISPSAKSFEERAGFVLTVVNEGGEPELIDTPQIEITSSSGALKIYSAAELEKEARNAAAWQSFAVAMSSASQSMANSQAAYSSSYTTARTNTYGTAYSPYGTTTYNSTGYGSATTTTYNPAVTQALEAQNRARTNEQMSAITSQLQSSLAEVQSSALQATTVRPGEAFTSKLVVGPVQLSKGENTVTVTVNFGADVHTFRFAATPAG
jgi:hypothetical protein